MFNWAEVNIKLVIKDICTDRLTKALLILDGLTSYHTEILGMPTWLSVPITHTALFLFKLYLSNTILDITDLIHYLSLPTDTILLIGTKILAGITTDDKANTLINSFKLSEIDMNNDLQNTIIRETLICFDQTLKHSTIEIWERCIERLKQSTELLALNRSCKQLKSTTPPKAQHLQSIMLQTISTIPTN